MNIFNKDGLVWWVGVVEDRMDPLEIGRCRVRIFGYHTEDTTILPTKDLPWAVPLQPITSAATSGVGLTPVGVVEGSWVVGWFLDGIDMQQPLIVGTIASSNNVNPFCTLKTTRDINSAETNSNYLRDSSGNVVRDSFGNPIEVESKSNSTYAEITNDLPPLKTNDIKKLMNLIAFKESSSQGENQNYSAENTSTKYIGKYQFGAAALYDLGYIKVSDPKKITNAVLDEEASWTGKDGITSKNSFFENKIIQESIMFQLLQKNYNTLLKRKVITASDSPDHVAGILATAHLLGPGNANKFDKKDGNGTRGKVYYEYVSANFEGDGSAPSDSVDLPNRESYIPPNPDNPLQDPIGPLDDPSIYENKGFRDPNKVYPTCEYSGRSDVNKLATGDSSHKIFTAKESKRTTNIPVAGGESWDQPSSKFLATYPYNQVIETEAGHVIEIDNSPGKERLHVYHKTGTFIEIDVNGTMIRKVVGDNYEILDRNNYTYIKGAHNLTVEGATKILIKDNASIYVDGNTNLFGYGDTTIASAGTATVLSDTTLLNSKNIDIVAEESLRLQAKNISMSASSAIAMRAESDITLNSKNQISLRASLLVAVDTLVYKLKMGAAKSAAKLSLPILNKLPRKRPDTSPIPVLDTPVDAKTTYEYDEMEKEAERHAANLFESGEVVDNTPKASNTATSSGISKTGETCDCDEFINVNTFPDTLKLSKHFTLGAVSSRAAASSYSVVDFGGLKKSDIVCNLKHLAVNCLDLIKDKYPDMIVTSGFRSIGTSSDHGRGMAADLQFRTQDKSKYFEIIRWIEQNVPHKQLLLEYETRATGKIAWIHIAYEKNNSKSPLKIATLLNHSVYQRNAFVNLA
ncbi:MAG: hypothetical protein EBU90_07560 [Proteobacteria bacterium]|nr:hypothetical protein [Pseudomonadota bacterium]NBP13440.1 hypothetical protein [bacterium]